MPTISVSARKKYFMILGAGLFIGLHSREGREFCQNEAGKKEACSVWRVAGSAADSKQRLENLFVLFYTLSPYRFPTRNTLRATRFLKMIVTMNSLSYNCALINS